MVSDPAVPEPRPCNGSRWCKAGVHDPACLAIKDTPPPAAPEPAVIPVDQIVVVDQGKIPDEFEPVVNQALLNLVLQGGVVAGGARVQGAHPMLLNRELMDQRETIEREFRKFLIKRGYDPVDLSRWNGA